MENLFAFFPLFFCLVAAMLWQYCHSIYLVLCMTAQSLKDAPEFTPQFPQTGHIQEC